MNGGMYYQRRELPSAWSEVLPGFQRGMEQARQRRKDAMQEALLKLQQTKLTES